ncbi:MAG: hypothetical protein K9N52_02730 [Verrucomicrobia bacterium]|nr:hypothetical protein [Verrucomicrobiota bacterium]
MKHEKRHTEYRGKSMNASIAVNLHCLNPYQTEIAAGIEQRQTQCM